MRFALPLILILASVGLFLLYINPTYLDFSTLRAEEKAFNEALDNSKKLQAARDTLVTKYNSFSPTTLDRLTKLLPDNVDNIKLVLEIDRIASQYGLKVQNIKYDVAKPAPPPSQFAQVQAAPPKNYDEFELEFSLEGSYGNFVNFLTSIERSLRIVDIQSVSFSSAEAVTQTGVPTDNYKYDLKVKTYWLKG